MIRLSVMTVLQQEYQENNWEQLKDEMHVQPNGMFNGEPYYQFYDTLNGSMEAVSQLINISVQPQESFIPYHLHNYIELTTPLMGQCTVEVNQQKITLNPGDVILIGNQTVHRVENIDQQTVVVNIEIRPGAFNINELETIHNQQGISTMLFSYLTDDTFGQHSYTLFCSNQDQIITNILDDIVNEYYEPSVLSSQVIRLDLLEFFIRLIRLMAQHPEQVKKGQDRSGKFDLTAALLYIEQNYADITLKDMAEHFGFNPNYLSGMLKERTKVTFIKLVKLQRVNVAAQYLIYTDLPIDHIATRVGYENASYFYKIFRQIMGESPKEYRCQARKK